MPSVRYYNQSAPFWDFVANLEEQGSSHPFFNNRGREQPSEQDGERWNPWSEGWAGFPFGGPFPHRGRQAEGASAAEQEKHANDDNEKRDDPQEGPSSEPRGPPPPFTEHDHHRRGPHHHPGSRGRCGGRGGRGAWGGRGRGGPFGGHPAFGPMGGLAEMFQSQLFGDSEKNNAEDKSQDFKPDIDVFDTPDSFIVHVSLPGAKKEDVGVNWDAEKSELNIAGVVYRPAVDEELLKTLALDERKVGAFERKVRLGSRANPAQVDVDGINAKLEDGVLRVDVPKLDAGYVEIKKVDIE